MKFLQKFLDNKAIVKYVRRIFDRAFSSDIKEDWTATLVVRCLEVVAVLESSIFVRRIARLMRKMINLGSLVGFLIR
jgi:hypothetical protein